MKVSNLIMAIVLIFFLVRPQLMCRYAVLWVMTYMIVLMYIWHEHTDGENGTSWLKATVSISFNHISHEWPSIKRRDGAIYTWSLIRYVIETYVRLLVLVNLFHLLYLRSQFLCPVEHSSHRIVNEHPDGPSCNLHNNLHNLVINPHITQGNLDPTT